MFNKSKILKKLSAGFMAGLCAFSMLGSSMSGVITANAASSSTENAAFPSADTVIAKAATLLGTPYTYGNKGYWYAYDQGQYQLRCRIQTDKTSELIALAWCTILLLSLATALRDFHGTTLCLLTQIIGLQSMITAP